MFPELTRDDVFRLETRQLWLRWPRHADTAALVSLAGDIAVAEMTALIPHPYARHEADRFILAARQSNAEGRALQLAITRKDKPTLLGMMGIGPAPSFTSEAERPHLGFWLGTPSWGQGLATEAAGALIDAYFAYAGGQELTAAARVVNPASRRVLEKCGFVHEGAGRMSFPARGEVFPVDRFRLDRKAWLEQRGRAWTPGIPGASPSVMSPARRP